MNKSKKFSPEVRERAVRLVQRGENPTPNDLHPHFSLGLVAGAMHAGRDDGHAVVFRQFGAYLAGWVATLLVVLAARIDWWAPLFY